MSNRPRLLIILSLLFSLFYCTPTVVLAQTASSNSITDPWGTVKALPPGTELEVKLDDGKKLKGRLLEVSDTTLRLSRKDEITSLDRANLLKVYQLLPRSGEFVRFATSTGAALGAGVGVIASRMKSRMLVYDSGQRPRVSPNSPSPNNP
jgi:hypothetical protein